MKITPPWIFVFNQNQTASLCYWVGCPGSNANIDFPHRLSWAHINSGYQQRLVIRRKYLENKWHLDKFITEGS